MDKALETESGLISIALLVYADFVKKEGGPVELQTRALALSDVYRNYTEEELSDE